MKKTTDKKQTPRNTTSSQKKRPQNPGATLPKETVNFPYTESREMFQKEQLFRLAFENDAHGMALATLEGRWMQVNSSLCRMLGYSAEGLMSLDIETLTHPEDRPAFSEQLRQLADGRMSRVETHKRFIHRTGQNIWTRVDICAVRNAQDRSLFLILHIEDTTGHKQAEEALAQSELRFRDTFEQAAVGIAHVSIGGKILRVNKKLCEILGYSPYEFLNISPSAFTDKKDRIFEKRIIFGFLDGRRNSYRRERIYTQRDGSKVWVDLTVSLVRTPDGGPDYFIYVIEDISRPKELELALQKSLEDAEIARQRLNELLQAIPDALIITGLEGEILLLNPGAEKLLGFNQETAHRQRFQSALPEPMLVEQILTARTKRSGEGPVEMKLLDKGRKEIRTLQVQTSVRRVCDACETITLLRDITREKESDRKKSEFIATAAHELGTPLTVIMGYVELLAEEGLTSPNKLREYLAIIYNKAQSLNRISEELLDLSRIETGRSIHIDLSLGNINALIRSQVQQFKQQTSTHPIELALQENDPPLPLDRAKIQIVLENILQNAVKFSPHRGPIYIYTSTREQSIQVSIEDQGIGMTPEQAERAFEKFYRADTSNTAVGGLGLGLTIARIIVESHGGHIWIESTRGKGTRVIFTLPITTCPWPWESTICR